MRRYSVQPRNQIFVNDYRFLSFAKNMGKNMGKNISKNVRGKYRHTRLDHVKQSATDAFKATSKRVMTLSNNCFIEALKMACHIFLFHSLIVTYKLSLILYISMQNHHYFNVKHTICIGLDSYYFVEP